MQKTDQEDQEQYVRVTNPNDIQIKPAQAGKLLGLNPKTLRVIEEDNNLNIQRVESGAVSARVYAPSDLFDIAALRRAKGQLKGFSEPIIVSTYVQKGGTGKTTIGVNLAINLGMQGLRVLIIDNDPQGDTSTMLGYDPDLTADELAEYGIDPERAIDAHLGNLLNVGSFFPNLTLKEVIKTPFGVNGPHLIPGDDSLNELDIALRATNGADFRYGIFFTKAMKGQIPGVDLSYYDVIIIDNAPSSSMLSTNAMTASDLIVCPIRMDKFSIKALSRLQRRLNEIEEDFARTVDVLAIPTMFIRRRPRAQANLATVTQAFKGQVSSTPLYHSEDYTKSLEEGIPLALWKSATENSQGAMREITKEIRQRMLDIIASHQDEG